MNKILIIFSLVLVCGIVTAQKSLTVTLPTVTASPGTEVTIPVKLTGASSSGTPISSANIKFSYDSTYLSFDTIQNFFSGMPASQWYYSGNDNTGIVAANWLEPNLLTVAVPDGTTLYEVKFIYKGGGNSPLTFTVTQFTDASLNLVATTAVNGAVNAITCNATFKVDMSNQVVSPNGVHLAGSFNGWNYAANAMTALGNGIYSATLVLPELTPVNYRFVNGNTQSSSETVPPSCGEPDPNGGYFRQIVMPAHDTSCPTVCFSMCSECPDSIDVTFRVDMQNVTVSASGVHIAGDFNGWNYGQIALTNTGGTVYSKTVRFVEGDYHEYRFVNGLSAQDSETVPAGCSVNGNRYITVPSQDTTLNIVCFDSCFECGAVMQYSEVTFLVDMQTREVSPDGVHLAGTFQGWNPGSTPMTDLGNEIFSHTESLLAGTTIMYKFVNGSAEEGYEIVPFSCSSNGNRILAVPANDTIIKLVCFGECDTCNTTGIMVPGSKEYLLDQIYPNPVVSRATVRIKVTQTCNLTLELISALGSSKRTLFTGILEKGSHSFSFESKDLPEGLYFCKAGYHTNSGSYMEIQKIVIH